MPLRMPLTGIIQRELPVGIHVTHIVPPAQGWPIAMYCPLCKETTFILSPWAIKPEKGDYWLMKVQNELDKQGNELNVSF